MKYVLILVFVSSQINAQPIFSDKGHPEHAIVGAVIGGGISYLVYKKTINLKLG